MSENRPKEKGAIWWVAGVAVVIVGGLILASSLTLKRTPAPDTASTGQGAAATAEAKLGELKSDQDRGATRSLIGRSDAPFKLVEYSDFL